MFSDRKSFEYFLMHGDHLASPGRLPAHGAMPADTRDAVRKLVLHYFRAGFRDPGIALLPDREISELGQRAGAS